MEEKKNKFEMLSAYVDGELNEAESAEILEMLQSDSELRQRLQKYSSISGLINLDRSDNSEVSSDLEPLDLRQHLQSSHC